jgi:hypothetical protein
MALVVIIKWFAYNNVAVKYKTSNIDLELFKAEHEAADILFFVFACSLLIAFDKKSRTSFSFESAALVASTGIEPVSGASETLILSIVLRGRNDVAMY